MNYAELLEVLRARRSIRRFADRPVPRGEMERWLEAARWAPSNHNRQPWKFLVVEDRRRIQGLAEAVRVRLAAKLGALPAVAAAHADGLVEHAAFFGQAPLLVAALHKRPAAFAAAFLAGLEHPELVSGEPLSVAMAVQNLLLAAPTLGLGACVLTAPLAVPEALRGTLEVPPGFDITCLVAVGYPAESPEPPRRKSLEHLVEFAETRPGDRGHDDRSGNP